MALTDKEYGHVRVIAAQECLTLVENLIALANTHDLMTALDHEHKRLTTLVDAFNENKGGAI